MKGSKHGASRLVFTELIADLQARDAVGMTEYGAELETWNGRDAGLEAYEEWLDQGAYLTQVRLERAEMRALLQELVDAHQPGTGVHQFLLKAVPVARKAKALLEGA